jgi:N-formylglutamate amidohydrolase
MPKLPKFLFPIALVASGSISQLPAIANMPTERTHYIQSSAAYSACTSYQSKNRWVGGLINARNLGSGLYGCDFQRACLRVNWSGQQASLKSLTGNLAKKIDSDSSAI